MRKEPDSGAISAAMKSAILRGPRDYSFSSGAFQRCLANHDAEKQHSWQYPSDASLGTYTFGEFRRFWTCLYTMCMLHICVCHASMQHVILYKTRFAWTEEISQRSGLSIDTALLILTDLVYDPALYQRHQQQPNIASQPFFPISDGDQLALSNILVIPTDAERNVWELTSVLRKMDFSMIEAQKERQWAEDALIPWLRGLGYEAWNHIKFDKSNDSEGSDVDLFVVDVEKKFALA